MPGAVLTNQSSPTLCEMIHPRSQGVRIVFRPLRSGRVCKGYASLLVSGFGAVTDAFRPCE
jgi:hypothetical protein